jgi:hypothetical protein
VSPLSEPEVPPVAPADPLTAPKHGSSAKSLHRWTQTIFSPATSRCCRRTFGPSCWRGPRAQLRERGAVDEKGKVSGWLTVLEKSQRALVSLSLRLRLSPQGRNYIKGARQDDEDWSTKFSRGA